jgi:hypothetical protein
MNTLPARLRPTLCALAAAAACLLPRAGRAQTQRLVDRADSLLAAGFVARAESLYYVAARRRTRDPSGRIALGRYLGARGAFRVGATLLEEAVAFGGDTAAVARVRAPLLQAADEWTLLAQLRRSPLTEAERARATWLATRAPAASGADSVSVAFEPSSTLGLGRVQLVIGADTLAADIDPTVDEMVIGDYGSYAALVQVFTGVEGDRAAVVQRASIGDLVLERIPARIDPALGPARARVGLAMLAKYAPTVDEGAGILTLRREGRVDAAFGRRRVALFFGFPGVRIARGDRLVPIESPAGRAVLAQARWTVDLRRGDLVLETDR